jgi:hypothetical protein
MTRHGTFPATPGPSLGEATVRRRAVPSRRPLLQEGVCDAASAASLGEVDL